MFHIFTHDRETGRERDYLVEGGRKKGDRVKISLSLSVL